MCQFALDRSQIREFGHKTFYSVSNSPVRSQIRSIERKSEKSRTNRESRAQIQKVARKSKKSRANRESSAKIQKFEPKSRKSRSNLKSRAQIRLSLRIAIVCRRLANNIFKISVKGTLLIISALIGDFSNR